MDNQELEAMNNENDQTPEATPTTKAAFDQEADASAVEAAHEMALAEDQAPESETPPEPDNPVVELALKDLQSAAMS